MLQNLLAFDTATDWCATALYWQGEVYESTMSAPKTHLNVLFEQIEALLARAHTSLAQLDAIGFGQGPGRFTGLRIAAAVAQTFGYVLHHPLIPVSTLAWHAQSLKMENPLVERVVVCLQASHDTVYYGQYRWDNVSQVMQALFPDTSIKLSELGDQLNAKGYCGIGEGFDKLKNTHFLKQFEVVLPEFKPEARALLPLCRDGLFAQKVVLPLEVSPFYGHVGPV